MVDILCIPRDKGGWGVMSAKDTVTSFAIIDRKNVKRCKEKYRVEEVKEKIKLKNETEKSKNKL